MAFETIDFILPAHWAPALINGDVTGMEDDEIAILDRIEMDFRNGSPFTWQVMEDEPSFVTYHDARPYGVLACDCLTYLATHQVF